MVLRMGDDDRDRLAALEGIVKMNTRRLDQGIKDQGKLAAEQESLRKAVESINATLQSMASDEIADLKRRAELPRRILVAVFIPVMIATITAVVGTLLTGAHI